MNGSGPIPVCEEHHVKPLCYDIISALALLIYVASPNILIKFLTKCFGALWCKHINVQLFASNAYQLHEKLSQFLPNPEPLFLFKRSFIDNNQTSICKDSLQRRLHSFPDILSVTKISLWCVL